MVTQFEHSTHSNSAERGYWAGIIIVVVIIIIIVIIIVFLIIIKTNLFFMIMIMIMMTTMVTQLELIAIQGRGVGGLTDKATATRLSPD